MKALAADGAPEGLWLRAERQTSGRGRAGRGWDSLPGNLHASTLVRLRTGDPPAPALALVAGVALQKALNPYLGHSCESGNLDAEATERVAHRGPRVRGNDLTLKWPNDLLVGSRKLAGILLERVEVAVIVGIGVNLAHHPDDPTRPATSLAAEGSLHPTPDVFIADLARSFAASLALWREDLAAIRTAWLAAAHPVGTPLATHGAGGVRLTGAFDGLDPSGACRLRLADGGIRLIHAGDVFLVQD